MSESLTIEGLTAGYRKRKVLRDLSLPPLNPGDVVALVGPNAAGKTTLLKALAGLVRARGSVALGSRDLLSCSGQERASCVAYMPQSLPQRVSLTVLEGVIGAIRAAPPGNVPVSSAEARERAVSMLQRLGIEDLALRALDELSGGQRQLASLAQAVVRTPSVLLLDEPTSALDLKFQLLVMRLVRELAAERSLIVIMVLHDVALAARWADRVAVLGEGRILSFGTPFEAITPRVLRLAYGVEARVERDSSGLMHLVIEQTAEDDRSAQLAV